MSRFVRWAPLVALETFTCLVRLIVALSICGVTLDFSMSRPSQDSICIFHIE
jgi:hypothetical protein